MTSVSKTIPVTTKTPELLSSAPSATLVVLSPGEEIAKRIESHLRNAGHPIRTAWITDLEDLEDALRRASPDLVLCADGMPLASPREVLTLCTRFTPDLPVLRVLERSFTAMDTVASLKAGMRGLVSVNNPQFMLHLEMICLRELRSHIQRRELRETRLRLADYESRYEKLMSATAGPVVHVQEGIITHANAAFAALLGDITPAALEGNPLLDWVADSGQTQAKQMLKLFSQGKLNTGQPIPLELRTQNGKAIKLKAEATAGKAGGDRLLEFLIRTEATASPVAAPAAPGAGRVELFQSLQEAIQSNVKMHRALLLVVADGFEALEQRLGHRATGQVLELLAQLLKQRLGTGESLFRFSTSELAIVASRASTAEFEALAETLRKDAAAQLFNTGSHEAHLAVTVVSYPLSRTDNSDEVVSTVVSEARKHSRAGGNCIALVGALAQSEQEAQADQRKVDQIKKALAANRLKLAYQSIASLEGDDRQHFDVLARMLDETGKEVPAREFIPTAEKFGLIVAVDRWVIARALGVLAKRTGAQDQSSLFVRISEQTLKEGDTFYRWLAEQVSSRPLQKEELVIAIQEPILESHVGKAKALCKMLTDLGAVIALDHFGAGTQSEKVLDYVPLTFVRFHYSFSKDFNDPKLQSRLGDLMKAAKEKNIRTIMGQVEDANALARLWQLGVNYIQGFHIQAPEAVLLSTDVRR